MNKSSLIFEQSPLLIVVCLLIGALYAFLLYQQTSPWSKSLNYGLASLRFVVVSILCFLLLLNPLMRQVTNTEEKPTIVFAIDNSQSIPQATDTSQLKNIFQALEDIRTNLLKAGIETDIVQLDPSQTPKSLLGIPMKMPSTNLSAMLTNVQNNYENRNLDKVVLVSDGIYNQGISPAFRTFGFPVMTLALGDSTPQRDLKLQTVLVNKVAYLGNEFPVVAEVENIGYPNRSVKAYLTQNGQILDTKTINFKGDNDIQSVTFYTTAKRKGTQYYVVKVEVQEGEFTALNNVRDVYVEVIDGREKILLVATAPHPDIKALRSAIEKNENYSFEVYMPGINTFKEDKYDVVIFHQIPSITSRGNELVQRFKNTPIWYILGAQSELNAFNRDNRSVKVIGRVGRTDQVTPVYNRTFNKFTFEADKINKIEKLPPVDVPFGEYRTTNSSQVLLQQRVGNIPTDKPLLVVSEDANGKEAVLLGEGLWKWRLEEYAIGESHESFDELINKVVQYLSTKEDKRRLRVYPINTEFYDFEKVVFESEVYNEIYERVYGTKINLSLTNGEGKTSTYSFVSAEGNTRFEISGLPKGVYNYTASAQVQGRNETSTGQFTVKDLQLEALNTTADFNLLRQLSQKTGGAFFTANQIEALGKQLLDTRRPNLIHSSEDLQEIINLKWLFFLLMGLITIEWGVRKYAGSY